MRSALVLLLATAAASSITASTVAAQGGSWPTTHQQATWATTTIEHGIAPGTSLWFDGNWRRMGVGADPQQVLLRPGLMRTLAPGVKVGGGYAYVATAPYGELPTATPLREHRLWQQLQLAHTAGIFALTHRYRWEQRWIAPVAGDGDVGRFEYQTRMRYMVRAQAPLGGLTFRARPVLAYAQEEALLPVGYSGAIGRFGQNRLLLGVGLPVARRQRLDLGYMNLWNALPARSANEVNHTLTVHWVITSGK